MVGFIRRTLRNTPVRFLYNLAKRTVTRKGQSDESEIIARLVDSESAPLTFVEFGFHPTEFNCIALAEIGRGLLIDGDSSTTKLAKSIIKGDIEVVNKFINLENIDFITKKFDRLGVLSIDVDGNDYWFLKALIGINPCVIGVEYNASMGARPITVPYAARFDRHELHASGWYHGASLSALTKLCGEHGYGLAAVSAGGGNAFFTRRGALDAESAWRPNLLREKWSGKSVAEQWGEIRNMPFVEV